MQLRVFFSVFLVLAAVFTGSHVQAENRPAVEFSAMDMLIAQVFPDPSMRSYTPSQIKAVMSFKVTPLISSREKKAYHQVRDRRDEWIRNMEIALKKNRPELYYRSMKKIVTEGPLLRNTTRKAIRRIDNAHEELSGDFRPFGREEKKWPAFARAEEKKLRKGHESIEKFDDIEKALYEYIKFRTSNTYETCILNPQTFTLNKTYLKVGCDSIRGIHQMYKKLLDKCEEVDRKAKSAKR